MGSFFLDKPIAVSRKMVEEEDTEEEVEEIEEEELINSKDHWLIRIFNQLVLHVNGSAINNGTVLHRITWPIVDSLVTSANNQDTKKPTTQTHNSSCCGIEYEQ